MNQREADRDKSRLKVVAESFKTARLGMRLSIRELAKMTGVSPSHLLRIESSEYDFTITKFIRICEALGLPVGIILESALFKTRDLEMAQQNVWDDPDLAPISESTTLPDDRGSTATDRLGALVLALSEAVIAMVMSSNPAGLARSFETLFPEVKPRLQALAERIDIWATIEERIYTVKAIQSRPFSRLRAMGVLDIELIDLYAIRSPGWVYEELPRLHLRWLKYLLGKEERPVLSPTESEAETSQNKKDLTDITPQGNTPDVHNPLGQLLRRLAHATREHGKKAALAKHLNLTMPRISEWLSGVKEPGGKNTLRLLEWVTAEEANQIKSPGNVSPSPRPKTRKPNEVHENKHPKSGRKKM